MINGLINYNSIAEQSLSCEIATWITAVSTFLMMVATCFMVYFTGKALNTWRTEEVLKQKSIQYRNLLEILIKIKAILLEIEGTKTINNTQRIYSVFAEISDISIDFEHLNESESIRFLQDIKNIFRRYFKYPEEGEENKDFFFDYLKNVDNIKVNLNQFLNEGRDFCNKKIKDFYKEQ